MKKINKTTENWLKKWRKYIFITITVSIVFAVSLLVTLLGFLGVTIPYPMVWAVIAFILGMLILIFGLIILGYLLLMVKPSKKK